MYSQRRAASPATGATIAPARSPARTDPSGLPGFFVNYNDLRRNSDVFRGSWDYVFSPTIFNHFYGGGNNWKENHDPPQATVVSGIHWKDKICILNVPDCDQNIVKFTFSNGYSQWGGDANNGSENLIMSFNDDVTMIKGKHTLKFGGSMQRGYYNGFGRQCIAGCEGFDFKQTGRPGDTNFTTAGGSPIASMLLGYANSGPIDTIRYIGQQWPSFAGFVQDDFRVRPNLTLNLGLRWETTLPPTGENDSWSEFSPTRPNPGADNRLGALIYAGSGTGREGTRSLADSYFKGFGPRFGMAYTVNSKTVVRLSYGISYGNITTVTGSTHTLGFTLTDTQSDSTGHSAALLHEGWPAGHGSIRRSSAPASATGAPCRGGRARRPRARRLSRASTSPCSVRSRRPWSPKSLTTAASAAASRRVCSRTIRLIRACSTPTAPRCSTR